MACMLTYHAVSEWYFKAAQSSSVQHTASNTKQPPIQPAGDDTESNNILMDASTDADATVIMSNHSQSPCGQSNASKHHNDDS